MSQELVEVYKHEDHCRLDHCSHCDKCLKTTYWQTYHVDRLFYHCNKCHKKFIKSSAKRDNIYINKEVQAWIERLTDLFCLDHTPMVILKYRDTRRFVGSCLGRCHWGVTPIVLEIYTDYYGHFELSTLVHEFLHATGYPHQYEINGWAHFGRSVDGYRDNFCDLIVRDLTDKKEVML